MNVIMLLGAWCVLSVPVSLLVWCCLRGADRGVTE